MYSKYEIISGKTCEVLCYKAVLEINLELNLMMLIIDFKYDYVAFLATISFILNR